MNEAQLTKTITFKGTSEGLDQLTSDLNKLAAATENVAVVTEKSAGRVRSIEDAYKRSTLRLDEGARAQANIARETRLADVALREQIINQDQHAERLQLIQQRYGIASQATQKFAQQTGLARYELINLGRQAQDVGVSLASGQSPFMVLVQQGTQIADVFASSSGTVRGFFSQAIGWAGRFVTSAAGVATGVASIAGGAVYLASSWVDAQKDIDKALSGIGGRSLATAKDINELADANAKSSRMSVSESREAALEFVKTGNIQKDNVIALTGLVDGFSKTIGKSSKEAAQELAKIFSGDVISGAQKLDAIFGTASSQQLQYIRNLENAGQRQEAIAATVRVFERSIKDAADQTGFWAASWNAVSKEASDAADAIGKALAKQTGIGQSPQERLASLQKELEMLQENARIRQEVRQERGLPAVGPEGAAGAERIRQVLVEIAQLEQKVGKGAEDLGKQFGKTGDDAVRSLLPYIEQLEKINKLISDIQNAQQQGTGRAFGGLDNEALNAAEVLKDKIKATADETARANAIGLQLKETYGTSSIEVAKTLDGLRDQAMVAAAVGGAAQMAAQEQARFNELVREGKTEQEAMRIAAAERAVTQARINAASEEATWQMENQLQVANAVGGAERMRAQEKATYNQLIHAGVGEEQAAAQASAQRALTQAQVNANAKETLFHLQNQAAVSAAVTNDEKIRAQAQATYNQLIHDGVDKAIALAVAAQQEANARAQATAAVEEQTHQVEQQTELIYARLRGVEATVKAEQAYENAIRSGADAQAASALQAAVLANENAKQVERAAQAADAMADAMARAAEEAARIRYEMAYIPFGFEWVGLGQVGAGINTQLWQTASGQYSQFNPQGYQSQTTSPMKASFDAMYGPGGYDPQTLLPNAQGKVYLFGNQFNQALKNAGGNLPLGIMSLINQPSNLFTGDESDTGKLEILKRGINLMSPQDQANTLRSLLVELKSAPQTLQTAEITKDLNDQLEQLTRATDANTDATNSMTDVLSPFYSSDPRRTHLGFRAFAGGGIMSSIGELPMMSASTSRQGGITSTAQAAMFGEGSVPEAYVPVPSGRIPVEINMPANSNQRPINVVINVAGNADSSTVAALKQTSFQKAQQLRRVTG